MKKVTGMFNEYLEFFSNFNVLGLAIGLMIGSNLKEVAGDFIDGLIMPFIKPILSTITGGKDLKFAALSIIIFIMLQLGVKIKKPVQWVSVRNWDKMNKEKVVKIPSKKSNKEFTM